MRLFHVDAFTGKPFAGNPAAVCLLTEPRDASWMQDVAREMNLSETAYVEPRASDERGLRRDDAACFDLRWFTPAVEVDLCGHATLASAHVLWETGEVGTDRPIRFHTRSGPLVCQKRPDRIEMAFPKRPVKKAQPPPGLLEAVGVEPVSVHLSEVSYLLELRSEQEVRDAKPDFTKLAAIRDGWTCITAPAIGSGFDFVSRFFAPQAGIDEDPVTGSAHCALADFWSQKTGRREFRAYQCSARGGVVHVSLDRDRVHLGGQAVTVLRGELV